MMKGANADQLEEKIKKYYRDDDSGGEDDVGVPGHVRKNLFL